MKLVCGMKRKPPELREQRRAEMKNTCMIKYITYVLYQIQEDMSRMDKKKYFDVKDIKGKKQTAIAKDTAKALLQFCKQEPEFEKAVEQSGKTYAECLDSIVKDVGSSVSDLEVYSKAVKFYFETAKVHFNMSIDLSGDNGYKEPPITVTHNESKASGILTVSLDELLDF